MVWQVKESDRSRVHPLLPLAGLGIDAGMKFVGSDRVEKEIRNVKSVGVFVGRSGVAMMVYSKWNWTS